MAFLMFQLSARASKRITLPKKWIPKIDTQNVSMHLIKEDATNRSYIIIDLSSNMGVDVNSKTNPSV